MLTKEICWKCTAEFYRKRNRDISLEPKFLQRFNERWDKKGKVLCYSTYGFPHVNSKSKPNKKCFYYDEQLILGS